jgi:hypothetical protein
VLFFILSRTPHETIENVELSQKIFYSISSTISTSLD